MIKIELTDWLTLTDKHKHNIEFDRNIYVFAR